MTSAAVYILWALPSIIDILEAELYAIKEGLTNIQNNKITKAMIFIRSLSNNEPNQLICEIQTLTYTQTNQNHKSI